MTDRYDVLGIPRPDLKTMCEGKCEGNGLIPVYYADGDHRDPEVKRYAHEKTAKEDALYRPLWLEMEAIEPTKDGWHFVQCPTCHGTGKKGPALNELFALLEEYDEAYRVASQCDLEYEYLKTTYNRLHGQLEAYRQTVKESHIERLD